MHSQTLCFLLFFRVVAIAAQKRSKIHKLRSRLTLGTVREEKKQWGALATLVTSHVSMQIAQDGALDGCVVENGVFKISQVHL